MYRVDKKECYVFALIIFQMNIFSDIARDELRHFGIYPFSVLHIKNKTLKQPMKPITISFPITEKMHSNEKLLMFHGENEEIKDITEVSMLEVWEKFVSVQLHHCFGWNML